MEPFRLKSVEFRREREATWTALAELVERVEKKGMRSLSARELSRLPILYRATLSSLSVARAISLDRALLEYLESLSARAYFVVYGTRRRLWDALVEFFGERFPAAVRRFRWHVALAAFFLVLGAVTAFQITSSDPDRFYTFVPREYAGGRGPEASTQDLRAVLYDDGHLADELAQFATFLFTHNAGIGMMAFALGFVLGLPVYILMFLNGLILGAFAALYHGRGLSVDLWGWLLPHGVTELLAVVLCGGAGLVLAQRLVFPGRVRRLENLARGGREAGVVVIGAVGLFFVAGLIEGVFRQTVHDPAVRYAVAITTALFWLAYFTLAGRRRRR